MKFTEAQLEQAFIELLEKEAYAHLLGEAIHRAPEEVLIKEDFKSFLFNKYEADAITIGEVEGIVRDLERSRSFSGHFYSFIKAWQKPTA